jgi:hypothetical protein
MTPSLQQPLGFVLSAVLYICIKSLNAWLAELFVPILSRLRIPLIRLMLF